MKSGGNNDEEDSPDGLTVELEERRPDVGEEEVWLIGGGEGEVVVGILGRLGGNESVSVASSSKGSGSGEEETVYENESCFICLVRSPYGNTCRLDVLECWETVFVVTAGCVSRETVFISEDCVNYVVFDWELVHSLLTNLNDCVMTNGYC